MRKLKPFFSFYGSKWRVAPHYPAPMFPTIVEPFAGSAGYSLCYADRQIVLVEKDPLLAQLWRWLIRVSRADVLLLPDTVECVDDVCASEEARWLIGFSLNQGSAQPKKRRSKSGSFKGGSWGPSLKQRIADQVEQIRHWQLIEGNYSAAPDLEATFFVDPPYQKAGIYYRYSSKTLDFKTLANWSRTRRGQVLVCENEGADWLEFKPFRSIAAASSRGVAKRSNEVLWVSTG